MECDRLMLPDLIACATRWNSSTLYNDGLKASPEPTAADVAAGARAGDAAAIAAFDRAGRALAAGIAATSTLLEVEATILGGGVMHASDLLLPAIQHHLGRYAALPFARTEVRAAALGTDAGLVGAAVLASAN